MNYRCAICNKDLGSSEVVHALQKNKVIITIIDPENNINRYNTAVNELMRDGWKEVVICPTKLCIE